MVRVGDAGCPHIIARRYLSNRVVFIIYRAKCFTQVHDSLQNLREYGAARDTGYFNCGAMSMQMSLSAIIVSLFTRLRDRKNGAQGYV